MSFRPRVIVARSLVRAGQIIKSLALAVMRPDDLIEFGRRTYADARSVDGWAEDRLVDAGLRENEQALLDGLPVKSGAVLLLGVGGGREAIPLARMGFKVTGFDFVPDLVRRAEMNAAKRGVALAGFVGEVSRIECPPDSFDVVVLSAGMYSSVPTRKRRVEMLGRIRRALKPEGCFVCQFHWDPGFRPDVRGEILRKAAAILTLGHLHHEPGDMLWGYGEFIHAFRTEAELRSEFEAGGFEILTFVYAKGDTRSGALLRKPADEAGPSSGSRLKNFGTDPVNPGLPPDGAGRPAG